MPGGENNFNPQAVANERAGDFSEQIPEISVEDLANQFDKNNKDLKQALVDKPDLYERLSQDFVLSEAEKQEL